MNNNEVLREVLQALGMDSSSVPELSALGGGALTEPEVSAWLAPEPTGKIGGEQLGQLLDGLIIHLRGPSTKPAPHPESVPRLTNNGILKKLRIALNLREPEVLEIFAAGGRPMGNRELTTLFRKPGTKHFRKCDDELLGAFLTGLKQRGAG